MEPSSLLTRALRPLLICHFLLILASSSALANSGITNTIHVTTLTDELDAVSSDGTGISLREAIRDARATGGDDELIILPAGTHTLTIQGAGENAAATGDLDIPGIFDGGAVTIQGSGDVGDTVIDASGLVDDRVFQTTSTDGGSDLTLKNLTITGARSTASGNAGGAIRHDGGLLTIERCVLADNQSSDVGGAIFATGGTILTVIDSTFHGNEAGNVGGAIYTVGATEVSGSTFSENRATGGANAGGGIEIAYTTATIRNSTFFGNSAGDVGGAIRVSGNSATLNLSHSTITGNTATEDGGGLFNDDIDPGTVNVTNAIIAGNTATNTPAGSDIGNQGPGINGTDTGNVIGGDPKLAILGDYGGATQTMPPLVGSPALDAGNNAVRESLDQLGQIRGLPVDAGAVEMHSLLCARLILENGGDLFTVTKPKDSGGGSLRDAIDQANASTNPNGVVILFSGGMKGKTIKLTSGELTLTNTTAPIVVAGASLPKKSTAPVKLTGGVIVSGNQQSRVFNLETDTEVKLFNLTIRDGSVRLGGGILSYGDKLAVEFCNIVENESINIGSLGGSGGGIYNSAILSIIHSTISGNQVLPPPGNETSAFGGGIGSVNVSAIVYLSHSTISNNKSSYAAGLHISNSTVWISNSTITGNEALLAIAGGIRCFGGEFFLSNSTVSRNESAGAGGGIVLLSGTNFTLSNSIVAGNTAASGNDNIEGTVNTNAGVNITSGDPMLAPLGNYGGPTETMPPLPGSPALDAADPGFADDFDQRGVSRPRGNDPDVGAVEYDAAFLDAFFTGTDAPNPATPPTETDTGFDGDESPAKYSGLVLDESGQVVGNGTVKLSKTGAFSLNLFIQSLNLKLPLKGTLEPDGSFSGFVDMGGKIYTVELQLVRTTGGAEVLRLSGTVEDVDAGVTYSLGLDRPHYHKKLNPSPYAGRFTSLLPTDPEAPAGTPKGDGYGIGSVSTAGTVKLAGVLPDNTKFTLSGFISADDEWRVFQKLYGKIGGRIGGTITFRDLVRISDFDGELGWVKNPATKGTFQEGIDQMLPIIGSNYRKPFGNEAALFEIVTANDSNASWQIGHGNVTNPGVKPIFWQGNNRIAPRGLESGEKLKVGVKTGNGFVSGSYSHSGEGTSVKFKGVAFQKQGIAGGVFPGNGGQTGFFRIEPDGAPVLQVLHDGNPINSNVDFHMGNVGIDGGIGEFLFEIRNAGDANLHLPGPPTLEQGVPFALVGGGPLLLGPGESSFFVVRFDPEDPGAFQSPLTIRSNESTLLFFVLGSGDGGSSDGNGIDHDQWSGMSPSDRILPYDTDVIGTFDPENRKGTYEGYVREDAPGDSLLGLMTLKIGKTGGFSATARIGGVTHTLKGSFVTVADDGVVDGTTNRGTAFHLEVVDADTGGVGSKIIGTIGDKVVELIRGWSHIEDGAFFFEGRYSIILPSTEERGTGQPKGDGYGTLTLANDGRIKGSMVLGDGTKVSHSGWFSVDSEWLFYKDIYGSKPKGFIGGRVVFREVADTSDFDGRFQWVKPENAKDKRFPRGFELRQTVLGSLYFAPPKGNPAFPLDFQGPDNLGVILGELGIPALPGTTEWMANNKIVYSPVGTERLSMKVNPKTGLINGAYTDKPNKLKFPYGAVIFPKQDLATGTVFGTSETGVVTITPVGP